MREYEGRSNRNIFFNVYNDVTVSKHFCIYLHNFLVHIHTYISPQCSGSFLILSSKSSVSVRLHKRAMFQTDGKHRLTSMNFLQYGWGLSTRIMLLIIDLCFELQLSFYQRIFCATCMYINMVDGESFC